MPGPRNGFADSDGPNTHFICVGFETRNEAEFLGQKLGFIGNFDDFDRVDAQRRHAGMKWAFGLEFPTAIPIYLLGSAGMGRFRSKDRGRIFNGALRTNSA